MLGALAILLPAGLAASPAGAATVRAFGRNPFNDILAAADAHKSCGLNRDELAAIMLAPIFPEAGGTSTLAPSPMTLSRWDTHAGLYYGGSTATPYKKTFWNPGVGLWQFDSAGGWNLIAADAINTEIVAQQAAKTMASRYCTSTAPTAAGKRTYAWGPWYGCANGCEAIFNEIYDGAAKALRMSAFNLTDSVGRKGGMVTRTCLLNGVQVTCSYIDPAAAQGNKAWAQPNFGPTPISAAFYDIRHENREWRVWLAEDTGYATTISADKPVTANARSSLKWSTSTKLCDVTASRGACGRVASTPWGPFTANPFGAIDGASGGIAQFSMSGWAIDPDTNASINVDIHVNNVHRVTVPTNVARPDVANNIPGYGVNHGFDVTVKGVEPGTHHVCAYAINVGPTGTMNPQLGCKWVVVQPIPPGPFPDVDGIHPFVTEIDWAVVAGIATGRSDGMFGPSDPVTRGAMAMFLWRAAGQPAPKAGPLPTFVDVPSHHPFHAAITWLASKGITTGYGDLTFRPGASITRSAVATFIYRYAGAVRGADPSCASAPFVDVGVSYEFCGEIKWLVDAGITTGFGDSTFRPLTTVTRQAMAKFLYQLLAN